MSRETIIYSEREREYGNLASQCLSCPFLSFFSLDKLKTSFGFLGLTW